MRFDKEEEGDDDDRGLDEWQISSRLRVNEGQPIGIRRSKSHVGPHVAIPHDVRCNEQRDQYHDRRVGDAPIERVEQLRIGKSVMRLVRYFVHFRMSHVFHSVHDILREILTNEAEKDAGVLYPPPEGVVRGG